MGKINKSLPLFHKDIDKAALLGKTSPIRYKDYFRTFPATPVLLTTWSCFVGRWVAMFVMDAPRWRCRNIEWSYWIHSWGSEVSSLPLRMIKTDFYKWCFLSQWDEEEVLLETDGGNMHYVVWPHYSAQFLPGKKTLVWQLATTGTWNLAHNTCNL